MRAVASSSCRILGLFELDQNGKVLYFDHSDHSTNNGRDLRGANFFTEIADFNNASELECRFETFLLMQSSACSFHFTCKGDEGETEVQVLMARLRKLPADYSFLIHIRRAEAVDVSLQEL